MILNEKEWKPVEEHIPSVIDNMYHISIHGEICDGEKIYNPDYPSSNGYNYTTFMTKDGTRKIFQIDMLMAFAFDMIGEEFIGKRIRIKHIDGDTRNDDISNLCVVEDVEEWRIINEPNVKANTYEISSYGRVRHYGKHDILKTRIMLGYEYISLMKSDNMSRNHRVHRLVAKYFIDNVYNNEANEVNHINGNKRCNYWNNLEWVTRSMNQRHAVLTDLQGNKENVIKLSIDEIDSIRSLMLRGLSYSEINKAIGINLSDSRLYKIKFFIDIYDKSNKYDKDVFINEVRSMEHNNAIPADIQDMIRDMLLDPKYFYSPKEILRNIDKSVINEYHITLSIINGIKQNKAYCYKLTNKYDLSNITYPKSNRPKGINSKVTPQMIDMIIEMLCDPKYHGSPLNVYKNIDHDKYPMISIYVVQDIKKRRETYNRSTMYNLHTIDFAS